MSNNNLYTINDTESETSKDYITLHPDGVVEMVTEGGNAYVTLGREELIDLSSAANVVAGIVGGGTKNAVG